MKVLIIANVQNEAIVSAVNTAQCFLHEKGIDTLLMHIPEQISGCTGCGKCWKKQRCDIEDEVNIAAEWTAEADALLVLSQVYYGEPAGQTIAFLERLFHCVSDRLAYKPAACAFASRNANAAKASERISSIFISADMTVLSHRSGCTLSKPEDILTLLGRMAYLLQSIQAGREKGIEEPENSYERILDYVR